MPTRKLWGMIAIAMCVLVGCSSANSGKTEPKKSDKADNSQAVNKDQKKEIDFFCERMKVKAEDVKQELVLSFDDEMENRKFSEYNIYVNKKPDLSGNYVISLADSDSYLGKRASGEEKESLGWESSSKEFFLYRTIEENEQEDSMNEVPLTVDETQVKSYQEKKLGTNDIWEAYSGFVNEKDHYMVSYVGDVSDGWVKGVFENGKWRTWHPKWTGKIKEDYHYSGYTDGSMWYDNGKRIVAEDGEGHRYVDFEFYDWLEEQGYSQEDYSYQGNYSFLGNYKILMNLKKKGESEYRDYEIDLVHKTISPSKIPYSYASKNGTAYCYDEANKVLNLYDENTGEITKSYNIGKGLNTQSIDDYCIFVPPNEYGYSTGLQGVESDDPRLKKQMSGLQVNEYKGTIYFNNNDGIFRLDEDSSKLVKILDANKQPLYSKMSGNLAVGKNEEIYILGFYGGGDDEGATDFAWLKPKE